MNTNNSVIDHNVFSPHEECSEGVFFIKTTKDPDISEWIQGGAMAAGGWQRTNKNNILGGGWRSGVNFTPKKLS